MDKSLVLPGDHLSSAEEAETGENTYSEKDEVYSAAVGENTSETGKASVKLKGRQLQQPSVGMTVYGVVIKASLNKAIIGCISASEAEGEGRGVQFDAVLPVTAIRRDYVRDIRDEVKIGDIIKAKVSKIEKTGVDLTMMVHECGVVCAFCPKCRRQMDLKEKIFICGSCNWKERRKLPLKEGESPPESEQREYRDRGSFGDRRGGFGGERQGYGGGERRNYGGERRGGFDRNRPRSPSY